jgi:hypothetical protein
MLNKKIGSLNSALSFLLLNIAVASFAHNSPRKKYPYEILSMLLGDVFTCRT